MKINIKLLSEWLLEKTNEFEKFIFKLFPQLFLNWFLPKMTEEISLPEKVFRNSYR